MEDVAKGRETPPNYNETVLHSIPPDFNGRIYSYY
jgi:hypothetical protein